MSTMPTITMPRARSAAGRTSRATALAKRSTGTVPRKGKQASTVRTDVRDRILDTASALFYEHGTRAVGVDLIVAKASVAKASLYRHFPTKDDLVVAYLSREDVDFWATWDEVAQRFTDDPARELHAHMVWIGARLARPNHRGCPQINVAAEFAEPEHPARLVSRQHMQALRNRLLKLAKRLNVPQPSELAVQLAVLINGAFASTGLMSREEATRVLKGALDALLAGAGRRT
jgi:AcrR family transcriptional regulator